MSFSFSQPKAFPGTIECVKNHYDYLKNKVLVSFRTKAMPEKEAFELSLHGNPKYETACDRIAKRLNELELAQSLYNLLPKSKEIPENTGNW